MEIDQSSSDFRYYVNHSLVVVKTPTQILLGNKKRGHGEGKWNCFGGKVGKEESFISAAARELKEECGLTCKKEDLKHVGILDFAWMQKPEMHLDHVFVCENFTGEVVETEEMHSKWFDLRKIPYQSMWQSDRLWLPLVLEKKPFRGYFVYDHANELQETKILEGLA